MTPKFHFQCNLCKVAFAILALFDLKSSHEPHSTRLPIRCDPCICPLYWDHSIHNSPESSKGNQMLSGPISSCPRALYGLFIG